MLYLKIGKDSVTTSRKFVKLYGHFHPPCVLHSGSAYTTCSSAVPHFQIEGERERRVSAITHTPATQLDPVVINGISDEVSDFLRRRAPKSPPLLVVFSTPFPGVLLFL